MKVTMKTHLCLLTILLSVCFGAHAMAQQSGPKNVVFILSDDHRFDFMSFMPAAPDFLETPNLDRMAREGMHFRNAFVSTSLCSPSRATILTGQYMHHHEVVDNQRPAKEGSVFFPQYLQAAGVQTAFVGKWHMGHDTDDPRPGFDYWCSFPGQGVYMDPKLRINNARVQRKGYNADVLTDEALTWLEKKRDPKRNFFLYVSYKAVHYPFQPAPRNDTRYADKKIDYPETMARTERNYRSQPKWVRDRRYSIHGIDHMETGAFDKDPVPDFDELFHNYCETLHGLDENIGRLLDYLDESGLARDTLVLYMGDNGFHLGEHGFYDKRDAYETSMRVPLLAYAPGHIKPGIHSEKLVQNIDIAPTILSVLGVQPKKEPNFDGMSFEPLFDPSQEVAWRDHILYEYHWEWNFPATPSLFAIRTDRYKYVYHHGVWDIDAFYDLETDPIERHNLISTPGYQERIAELRTQLFKELAESGAKGLPLKPPAGDRLDQRKLPN